MISSIPDTNNDFSFTYTSVQEIIDQADKAGKKIWEVILTDQAKTLEVSEEFLFIKMKESLYVMQSSAKQGLKKDLKSVSGLSGGDGYKMNLFAGSGKSISGSFGAKATAIALGIQEYNAAMGKIVAAPTAGSCGILPAGVITMMNERGSTEEEAIQGLITAGAIGMVIATKATVSGAQGGCQAECGSAAAMTAAALVEMNGGSPQMAAHSVAFALQNLMGLVCDPVAGLVEVPCVLRNGCGIAVAVNSADLALAGIKSVIPVDEVIITMGEVGNAIPASLRETSLGGLATTPTGIKLKEEIFG